jgi:hypothetical protein
MKKKIFGLSAIALMIIMMSSCSKVPTIETEAAYASIEAAKTAEANRYLTAEYNALNDSLTAVLAAVEVEKEKSASVRNFKPMAEKLTLIAGSADALAAKAEIAKAEMRIKVEEDMASLTYVVAEKKETISKIKKTAKNAAELEAMNNSITIIESTLAEINTLVANGDYLTAREKVVAAKGLATTVFAQVN